MNFVRKITVTGLDVYLSVEGNDCWAYFSIPTICSFFGIPRGSGYAVIPKKLRVTAPALTAISPGQSPISYFVELGVLQRALARRQSTANVDGLIALIEKELALTKQVKGCELCISPPPHSEEQPTLVDQLRGFVVEREALLRYQLSDECKLACEQMVQRYVQERKPGIEKELEKHVASSKRVLEPEIERYRVKRKLEIDAEMDDYRAKCKRKVDAYVEEYRGKQRSEVDGGMVNYKRHRAEEIDRQLIRNKVASSPSNSIDVTSLVAASMTKDWLVK